MHDQAIFSTTEKRRKHISNITNSFIPSLRQKILLKRNIVALQTRTRKLENLWFSRERYIIRPQLHNYALVLVMLTEGNRGYRLLGAMIIQDTVVIEIKQP